VKLGTGIKLRFGLVCPLIFALTFALAGFGQSKAEQDSSTNKQTTEPRTDKNGSGKQIGRGSEDIGKGVGKGSADLGKGVAGGVGEVANGHGVGVATSVGKGTVGFGKNVGAGTGKGAGKIGNGIGGEFKKLGRKSKKGDATSE
jgi:hypothetical protein